MPRHRLLVPLLGLIAAGAFILACGTAPLASTITASPTAAAPAHYHLGVQARIGTEWAITVTKLETYGGGVFDAKPGPGDTYLLISLTMKNISTSQRMALFADYTLRDLAGNGEKIANLFSYDLLNTNVTQGEQVQGKLIYEIPSKVHQYLLSYAPSDVTPIVVAAEWDLTTP